MDVKSYDCPNCGANLQFVPDKQKFCCEYCLGEFTETEINQLAQQVLEREENEERKKFDMPQEPDLTDEQAKANAEFEENTHLYQCPTCGAQIVCDSNTAASFCYYCHNPVILKGRVQGLYRPSKVLPFSFGKEKAEEYFNDWTKNKRYILPEFQSGKQLERLTGLYVPFWVANSEMRTHFTAKGINVRQWTSGNYHYTETSEYAIIRDVSIFYEGVPGDGSQKIEDSLMEAIEPFDYSAVKDFDMAYLSGFYADKYDVEKEKMYPRIYERMLLHNTDIVSASFNNYSRIVDKKYSTNVEKINWDYYLLPVWFMTFNHNGRMWEYAVNGQTGKIAGELPINEKKLRLHKWILSLLSLLVVLVIGYFLGNCFGGGLI